MKEETFRVQLSRGRLFRDFLVNVSLINGENLTTENGIKLLTEQGLNLATAEIYSEFECQHSKNPNAFRLRIVFLLSVPKTTRDSYIGMLLEDGKSHIVEFGTHATFSNIYLAGWEPIGPIGV